MYQPTLTDRDLIILGVGFTTLVAFAATSIALVVRAVVCRIRVRRNPRRLRPMEEERRWRRF